MKKTLLISGVLLALTASVAAAGGINLAWDDCGGPENKAFACNTNAGFNNLVLSFDPDVAIPDLNGSNPIVDLQTASPDLPAWWQFKNVGTCRQNSLLADGEPGSCPNDPWQLLGTASIAGYFTQANAPQIIPIPNRARMYCSISVPGASAAAVTPGNEYFLFRIRINNAKTVGTGLCDGCQVPVCLVLNEVLLTSSNSGDNRLYAPLTRNFVTWQGGAIGGAGCPGATPAVNKTWGQLKSIYR
jgi:hypothetical protein